MSLADMIDYRFITNTPIQRLFIVVKDLANAVAQLPLPIIPNRIMNRWLKML